jgi:hypothetical protein
MVLILGLAPHFTVLALAIAMGLFLALLAMIEGGRRWGRRAARGADGGREGLSGAEGAVYGLLGLLVAFSFSGAASRFDNRRDLLVAEANAVGTAYLRVDVLPPEAQPALRDAFRKYLDSRLAAYGNLPDLEAFEAESARSVELQGALWKEAVGATRAAGTPAPQMLLPPLNEMFDMATTRSAQRYAHPPVAIFVMLVGLALVSAFIVGFGMAGNKQRTLLHELAYAAVLATVIYVIIDLEFPRLGLIRVEEIDQVLVDVRKGMD